jgi:hypothetical protein
MSTSLTWVTTSCRTGLLICLHQAPASNDMDVLPASSPPVLRSKQCPLYKKRRDTNCMMRTKSWKG